MNITVVGGDKRQARLAELFAADGHRVCTFGTENVPCSENLGDALKDADVAVLPLPALKDGMRINAPAYEGEIYLGDVLDNIRANTAVIAGKAGDVFAEESGKRGIKFADYYQRDDFTVPNAAATAEGAVGILINELPVTLMGSRILIIGCGRIGKILARMLRDMRAEITVSARKREDFAWIKTEGYLCADTRALEDLGRYDAIVNTVPHIVLDEARLENIGKDCFVLDLASAPGGVDFAAAAKLGIRINHALGLPGKTAPESAAIIIRDAIYNIIEEQECSR